MKPVITPDAVLAVLADHGIRWCCVSRPLPLVRRSDGRIVVPAR
ncbi:hypothetical protein ACQEU1_41315 [Lentzea sp. CA-135723]